MNHGKPLDGVVCAGGHAFRVSLVPEGVEWLQYAPTDGDAPASCNPRPDEVMYAIDSTWYRARTYACITLGPDPSDPAAR